LLESAGRPEVMASKLPDGAVGLAQILPSTATDLLGMHVDLGRSIALTREIARALRKHKPAIARKLADQRRAVDDRFDPKLSVDGAARYLELGKERFGRDDLALASYHMGIGNLENVIAAYSGGETGEGKTADLVARLGLSYARLYFDSSPQT